MIDLESKAAAGLSFTHAEAERVAAAERAAEASRLAEAEPIMKAAEKAVANLSKADVGELKGFKAASKGVVLTAEALCLIFKVKPLVGKMPEVPVL